MMLIINEQTIASLADPVELTDVMEAAMLAYAQGDYIMPDRSHMNFNGNTLLMMPSLHGKYFGTKIVSLFPGNLGNGNPVLYGTVILNDGSNGKPLAMLNGAKLTAVRTAAVGSAGIRQTAPENAQSLGVIGAGVQGFNQTIFACKNRPVRKVFLYDQSEERLEDLYARLTTELPDVEISIAGNPEEICKNSEIIITATSSTAPVLPDDPEMLSGKSIIAIGSYKPEMLEMPDALYPLLEHFFIDVDVAVEESGDLIHPLSLGLIKKDQVKMLSDAIAGKIQIDKSSTTIYKSVGMALFDLFAAQYFYQKALKTNTGIKIQF